MESGPAEDTDQTSINGIRMKAMAVYTPAPIETDPLRAIELPDPEPGPREILVRVKTCGVCRTDLHVAEGDLPANAVADIFPAYDDDQGGVLVVLTPTNHH